MPRKFHVTKTCSKLQYRRRVRPHRRIVDEGALPPFRHRLFGFKAVTPDELFERSFRSLYRCSDGVRGRGGAG